MSNVLVGTAVGDALGVPFESMLVNNPALEQWDGRSFGRSEHHGLEPGQYSDEWH